MRSFKKICLFIVLLASLFRAHAQDIPAAPNPARLVNDYGHLLSTQDVNTLEAQLVALDDSTSNQIAIVTIPTLNDYPIEDYANKLFRTWGIGGKKNNGILILVAVNDHKIRIEIGYGLEGVIPDVTTSDIIANDLTPNFKQSKYFEGFEQAIESLSKAAAGEYHIQREKSKSGGGFGVLGFIIIIAILLLIFGRGGSGGGGGDWIAPFIIGNAIGRGFDSGGNSGGFGGEGGGGFGGFGGGSSGGGGASGGW